MFSLKRLLFLLFSILPFFGFSQKEAANWYFGDHAGVNFNTTPPSLLTDGELTTPEGCSAISDANGNLLFYTDGITIWNANHTIMEQGLLGDHESTSSALIVPHPTNMDLFYVFTIGKTGLDNQGLNYSVVDMNLNSGLGDVLPNQKNIHLAAYPTGISASEKLTATIGVGCDEYWVLSRASNKFYAFKIDNNGVHEPVITQIGPTVIPRGGGGYMKFSPDGTMVLAIHNQIEGYGNPLGFPASIYLYDFNKSTGQVSNPILLYFSWDDQFPLMLTMYGLEFSLGSTKVYATSNSEVESVLYQWDLESEDIAASLFKFPNAHANGALQLAPNGKIYVPSALDPRILNVINQPEKKGLQADYSEDPQNGAILFPPGTSLQKGLPQFTPSLLFPWIRINIIDDSEDIVTRLSRCKFEGYTFSYDEALPGNLTYAWYKNDMVIPGENTNTLVISPPPPGNNFPIQVNYKLEISQVYDGCLYQYQGVARVTFHPLPEVFDVVFEQCQMQNGTTSIYNLNFIKEDIVDTAPVADYTFEFFPSLSDAQNNDNQITDISAYYSSSTPQVLGVKITNNETGCFNFSEVTLIANQNGFNHPPIEISACDTNLNGIHLFNLNDALPELINGNNQLEVNFFETMEQAYTEMGAIEDLFTFLNDSSPYFQTIYVRLEENGVCSGIREIHLIIEESPPIGPDLTGENSLIYCMENLPEDMTLSSGVPENQEQIFNFLWTPTGETTPTINTHELGEYTVTVVNIETGCKITRTINIVPETMASFTLVHNDPSENNSITVVLSEDSIGDYEYALDDGPYQDSNIFDMVPAGLHTVYVRNKNGCGVSEKEIGIIGLMQFFTPNADGVNDYWNIIGAIDGQQMLAELYIYDRYGKLLKTAYGRSLGWDGTYNGKKMPSNDYWYCIVLEDGKVLKGNFTLKR